MTKDVQLAFYHRKDYTIAQVNAVGARMLEPSTKYGLLLERDLDDFSKSRLKVFKPEHNGSMVRSSGGKSVRLSLSCKGIYQTLVAELGFKKFKFHGEMVDGELVFPITSVERM